MRSLSDVTSSKSDDAKAPLKAVRKAIEIIVSSYPEGCAAPEVNSLFSLCRRIREVCEERVATHTDIQGAQRVQDYLRYRLTRLITGSSFDAHPDLKLRFLKLIFTFMEQDNKRLSVQTADIPSLRLTRTLSIGRSGRGANDLGPRRTSLWTEAVDEVGRMPGPKLMAMMKLLLTENQGLAQVSGAGQGGEQVADAEKQQANNNEQTQDLLLGDFITATQDDAEHGSRSFSPAPSSVTTATDDPFISLNTQGVVTPLNEATLPNQLQRQLSLSSAATSSIDQGESVRGVHTPTNNIPINMPGHFGGSGLYFTPCSGSTPMPPFSYGTAATNNQQQTPSSLLMNNNHSSFDASSPYLGVPHPFEDTFFNDVAPQIATKKVPSVPPAHPPMKKKE